MVFDLSSSICRFASAPAASTSRVTRLANACFQASRVPALGWRGALLGLAVTSPGLVGSGDAAMMGWGRAGGVTSDGSVGTDAGRAGAADSRFVGWRSGGSEALDRGFGGRLTTSVRARPAS